ncbi:hypothetical protein [Variovorax sp. LjRoot175]|uniref:hypothetical protein n=1 Tax=Variovorax sp. LjRoot175 TaxID=3342276 RepID=UPI003F512D95
MAGSARFTAILDACVLYPQLVRDVLMRLTFAGLYHARWSATIEEEWTRNLLEKRPEQARAIERTVSLMRDAVPDCLVVGYEKLVAWLDCRIQTIAMFWPRPSRGTQMPS